MGTQGIATDEITISSNQVNWNLITDGYGGSAPTKQTNLTITINAGVVIHSSAAGDAMDLRGMPEDSTITLINSGKIFGLGGDGGRGESCDAVDDS